MCLIYSEKYSILSLYLQRKLIYIPNSARRVKEIPKISEDPETYMRTRTPR